ncbi:hypothetical protein GCM10012275_42280 [Longimycelium tulufanense]|uniref:Uncharacterized protein n=1 Tax=Longimycelium tulufanense TaxID=907463 RepID=A0A8J3FXZ6_9PSEU|nr:hypothetical protein GCM10012275_42280 [Longimycelium tulufanense]
MADPFPGITASTWEDIGGPWEGRAMLTVIVSWILAGLGILVLLGMTLAGVLTAGKGRPAR